MHLLIRKPSSEISHLLKVSRRQILCKSFQTQNVCNIWNVFEEEKIPNTDHGINWIVFREYLYIYIYMIWTSSKTRNDSKFLDELTERGFCTMFLICQVTYSKETNADSLIKRLIFLVINCQLFLLYNFSKFLYIFTLFIHPSLTEHHYYKPW